MAREQQAKGAVCGWFTGGFGAPDLREAKCVLGELQA
jgi:hypothetical protein